MPSVLRRVALCLTLVVTSCDDPAATERPATTYANALVDADGGAAPAHESKRIWRAGGAEPFPRSLSYPAGTGTITTLNVAGPTPTDGHPFFTPLGANGRACITCHQPADGMSLSARTAAQIWEESGADDPLFAAIDGSNCPSLPQSRASSHSLVLEKGLFRIPRPWPPLAADGEPIEPEFTLEVVRDPTGCNLDRRHGLYSARPMVSVYRRPRPAANLKYVTGIGFSFDPKNGLPLVLDRETGEPTSGNLLSDVRERTLRGQARDALLAHIELHAEPSAAQLDAIIAFETQLFTAQSSDPRAGDLTSDGALGGPEALAQAPAARLQSAAMNPIWGEFTPWANLPAATSGMDPTREFRESVARGAKLFATRWFLVSDSAGITDTGFGNPVRNSCAFCHNMLHSGMDVAPGQVDLGTTNLPHANEQPDLPLFRLTCHLDAEPHPHLGRVVYTHDPGYALTTGKCIDIGKITAQNMRGLSGRAPYFVNGSAKTLADVVTYYDERYTLELTDQEKMDLQHLLEVL